MSSQEILEALSVLAVAYPEQGARLPEKVLEAQTRLYCRMLADIDPQVLRRAVERHIRESEWYPKVAELRRLAVKETVQMHFEEAIQYSLDRHDAQLLEAPDGD